ncbi:YceD family protein [Pararhodobacter oceanensis]|uniref:YceD family protein n=1 Tax=Pararhodobacter oceanensis TaxID=2172121 RepID=UPI0014025834|nr:DUF177 domain-containing protein [Pararhodobacter oceanensis]
MSDTAPLRQSTSASLPLRVADLPNRTGVDFTLTPDAEARAAIAERLDLQRLRKLTFTGKLRPDGHHDWQLEATLGATAVQSCVVTFAPVTTRLDVPVQRRFLRRMPEITDIEVEIPDDDIEPLGPVIDLGEIMEEALSLALPDYPRAEDADETALPGVITAGDEAAPAAEEPERQTPFANLSSLLNAKKDE